MNKEIEIQKKYWDKEVDTFDSIYTHGKSGLSNWLDKKFRWDMYGRFKYTLKQSEPIAGKTFLDVGCGTGLYALEFARQGAKKVVGIDIAENMIKVCNERAAKEKLNDKCDFSVGDLIEFKPAQKYDVVIGIGLFDYISDSSDVLKKMHDVSADRVIATFPRSGTWRAMVRKIRLSLKGCPVYFYSEKQLDRLLKGAGFVKYSTEIIGQLFCITANVKK